MKAYLQSFDLWKEVEEDGKVPPLPANPTLAQIKNYNEGNVKKFKAINALNSTISENILTKLMASETPKEIWDFLQNEYLGNDQSRLKQVLNLKREFEIQKMREFEWIKDYVDRLTTISNKIRLFGEKFSDSRIVEKVLVSLPEKFESKISSLEDSKDLSNNLVNDLVNALQVVEQRRAIRDEKIIEQAFVAKIPSESTGKVKSPPCGICKKNNHAEKDYWFKGKLKCFNCKRPGHKQKVASLKSCKQIWYKRKKLFSKSWREV
ncbi:uncharacterized protein LOC107828607 [Nicotiana tabacum]|uniref:Uncharacterized protein LOC107828607 n=1 Tax=Nicotiana tabacum TaxID=4097 RepID=A0A1S4DDN9_TOBAC|nr:PREDICTED: uncharacterized protein LOC107828607 [Nicotiana tabacum]